MGHQFCVVDGIDDWRVCRVEVLLFLGVVVVEMGEGLDVDVGTVDVAGLMQFTQDSCLWRTLEQE
jgi:hypothetical protein